ncbi:class I SAM-dependent methyltransferase [Bacteroides sp. An19]|uniref:class I SAM-dependent methyltransferase n=1 Tax=Bacteroides sp. An19 TaxID=1965580 RepID=UPI000B378669|nr:class I SAM-dependent methyltransferase [Bacteroides sp. An19]OUP34607.1 hypothetical protein B5F25_05170 [Bacteroides sp. An19]
MVTDVYLPKWLDKCIFTKLKANYCCSNSDMTVIDWDKKDVLNYLGTYFPRSYAEAYCIFHAYFDSHLQDWTDKEKISVFDFGCGTGGEIVGMLMAVSELLPNINTIDIIALDGNQEALRLFEQVMKEVALRISTTIKAQVAPIRIDDLYDLSLLDSLLTNDFDIIMSFKAICEFVTKERFEKQNAYEHIARSFLPKLKENGMMLLVDVTTYNNVSQEWLPIMMDKGLKEADCNIVLANADYNQIFTVSHSKRKRDKSKVAWRIIEK